MSYTMPEYDHELKVWSPYFHAVAMEEKRFEVRKDDRGFQRGQVLRLREWDQNAFPKPNYTGNEEFVHIDWILTGGQFGIEPGYVVMSISILGDADG